MSQASHNHWSYFWRLDHPQGSSHYLFLLLFHIEDNVQFKFRGDGEFKNSKKTSKIQLLYLLTSVSYVFLVVWLLFACVFLSLFCLFRVSYDLG